MKTNAYSLQDLPVALARAPFCSASDCIRLLLTLANEYSTPSPALTLLADSQWGSLAIGAAAVSSPSGARQRVRQIKLAAHKNLDYVSLAAARILQTIRLVHDPLVDDRHRRNFLNSLDARIGAAETPGSAAVWVTLLGVTQQVFVEMTEQEMLALQDHSYMSLPVLSQRLYPALTAFPAGQRVLEAIGAGLQPLFIRTVARSEHFALMRRLRLNESLARLVITALLYGADRPAIDLLLMPYSEMTEGGV